MSIDRILRVIKRFILFICAGLFAAFVGMFLYFAFDFAGTCLENGGVWDGAEKRCRYDCLTWNERDGCVPLEKMKVEKVRAK